MRSPALGRRTRRLAALALIPAAALLAACTSAENTNPTSDEAFPNLIGETSNGVGFPHQVVTSEGILSSSLYLPVFIVAVVIFLLVEGLLIYMAIRFRRKDRSKSDLPDQTHGNNTLEVLWTVIPAIIVTIMFIGSTIVLADVQSMDEEPAVVVDAEAFRFGWKFDYMDPTSYDAETETYQPAGVTVVGGGREGAPQLVLPVDQSIRFRLTAVDVIHSWYVPAFFFKRDAIPGRLNEFELTIEEPGTYGGQCAEFCGLAHSDMFFSVRAVSADEYSAWLSEQSGPPPGGDGASPGGEGAPPGGEDAPPGGDGAPADAEGPPPEADGPPPAEGAPPGAEGPPPAGEAKILAIATTAEKPIAFDTNQLEAKAGQPVELEYSNDARVPHNIAVYSGSDAGADEIAESEIITGPGASTTVSFNAPTEPGAYFFRCELHPLQMTGTLQVVS